MRPCVVSLVPSFCAKQLVANSTVAILGLEQNRMNLPCMTQAKHLNLNPSLTQLQPLSSSSSYTHPRSYTSWLAQKAEGIFDASQNVATLGYRHDIQNREEALHGFCCFRGPRHLQPLTENHRKSKNLTLWAFLAVLCNFVGCKSLASYHLSNLIKEIGRNA